MSVSSEMVVSAADTVDINGRDLTFDWVVLRGDHSKIRITPLTPDGRYAHIEMDWQEAQPAPGSPDILSSRIDIGVFANNGVYDSAPSFVSVLLPQHETRLYEEGPQGPRALSIDRAAQKQVYSDPLIYPVTRWKDSYRYGSEGEISGWQRLRGKKEVTFDAKGQRLRKDEAFEPVRYDIRPNKRGLPVVFEEAATEAQDAGTQ